MNIIVTTKGFKLEKDSYQYIEKCLRKIKSVLPTLSNDLVVPRIIINKQTGRYFPAGLRVNHKSYLEVKPALSHYSGSISFRMKKEHLFAHFRGKSVNECMRIAYKKVFKELEKFKDTHFFSESEYPDHTSIRGS